MSLGRPCAVVYDLDSTIAHTQHRWHLSPMKDPSSSWEKYSRACKNDTPLPGTVFRMKMDWPHYEVHICSGRDAAARDETVSWLDINVGPWWDHLELRRDPVKTNIELKVDYIRKLQRKLQVLLVYEDWAPAAEGIYEQTGVPVLGVTAFYPEELVPVQQDVGNAGGRGGGL